MKPSLFIIIVNWNLKTDTAACIRSLVQAKANLSQIIVIDNGSSDGSVPYLREIFGTVLQIIELDTNIGFAAATNLGIRKSMDQGAEWLLLLNNDTWVAEDFFEKLLLVIETQPSYSVFGPTIFFAGERDLVWFLGDHLVPGTMLTTNPYRGKPIPSGLSEVLPVDFLSGCAMLVNRKAFEDTGLLDANLFMYGEEVDWCWRVKRAGHRLAAVPLAMMWHKVSASSSQISTKARYLRVRNQIWGYRRYGNVFQWILLVTLTFLRVLWMSLKELISGNSVLWQSTWKGWIDGWWQRIPPIQESYQL
jgi:GT2 family glycosyltransferase